MYSPLLRVFSFILSLILDVTNSSLLPSSERSHKVQEFHGNFHPGFISGACRQQGAGEGMAPNLWSWKSSGKPLGCVLGWILSLEQGDFM